MASGVVAKRVGLRELTDGFVQRDDIQTLMQRVEIVTTSEYDDGIPRAPPPRTTSRWSWFQARSSRGPRCVAPPGIRHAR